MNFRKFEEFDQINETVVRFDNINWTVNANVDRDGVFIQFMGDGQIENKERYANQLKEAVNSLFSGMEFMYDARHSASGIVLKESKFGVENYFQQKLKNI